MYITGAMINSKDVLEMKLNNSIVYSSAPAVNYNYTLSFASGAIAGTPPTWMNTTELDGTSTNSGFRFSGSVLINDTFTAQYGNMAASLGFDLSQATKPIKMTINYYIYTKTYESHVSNKIQFRYATPAMVTQTVVADIVNTNASVARTDVVYIISLDQINAMKTAGQIGMLYLYHYNGWSSTNDTRMYLYSVKFEEVV